MEDNQIAIAYSKNALVSEKIKHIDVKWHFFKDHLEKGKVMLRYFPTDQMLIYLLTKLLISLSGSDNGYICTLNSGGVLALHT
jgi:hypothetical protein